MNEEALFAEALGKKGEARAAFLDEHCKEDVGLRKRLEALLRAHDNPDPFLEAPAPAPVATVAEVPVSERPGTVIGPYKLLQQIGEGGMGTVWMAQQTEPVKRLVALKLIKAGMDSKQVIARFEAERQALALMDHPNIARVLDAGTTSAGRPYFVMDLVKGVPISRYCDEHHLTPRQRLELFIPVCQAIQHAHQKGIIHRDLKPSNVLIALYDGKPVPKVIDFGVAKAAGQTLTEKTLVTGFGAIVGTLEYMSPEQAEINQLDIDTRSDIYSLGVLLYELLAGSPPFTREELEKGGMLEMLRVIREQEPSKPSTKLSTADGLPTLAANRGTEPAKLMKLVRGELDWIVMKALEKDRNRRYESANGFARDLQRYLVDEPVQACPPSVGYRLRKFVRRNKAALVMVSVVTLAVLLVVGSLGWMARDRTAREQEIARDRATRQAVIRERVTLALEEARKRHQEGRWREALDAAKRAEALAATGGSDEATHQRVREVLGDMQMLANLEDVRARSTTNESGFDLKEEDSGTARAFREYGIDIDALDRDVATMRIRARSIRYELTVFLDSWSHVRRRLANPGSQQIGKVWRELLEVARAADPDPWRDRFRKAVLNDDRKALVELAASAPISSLPAETVDRLGDALLGKDTIKEAAAFLKKGQRLHPQDYWINVNLANCLFQLGPQQLDDAIRYYTAAVALRPEAALSHSNLGNALKAHGKLDEAIACYRKAIEINPKHVFTHIKLGVTLERQKKPDEAIAVYRQGLERLPDDVRLHLQLAHVLWKQNRLEEAAASFRQAIKLNPSGNDYYQYHYLGCVLKEQKKPNEAVDALRKAIAINPKFAPAHYQLGLALGALGQDADARGLLDEAAAEFREYERLTRETLRLKPYDAGARDALARCLNELAWALATHTEPARRDLGRAVSMAREAVELMPQEGGICNTLGTALYRAGRWEDAIKTLERADQLSGGKHFGFNAFFIAMAHWQMGNKEEASRWYDRAALWMDKDQPKNEELRRFRAEAAALMKVKQKKD